MNPLSPGHPDAARSKLRGLVSAMEVDIGVDHPLRSRWTALVDALLLGEEPDLRTCPTCGKLCMTAASRCGHCWTALTPVHA